MPAAFILSLAQLGDRAILRLLLHALALTLTIFAGVAWGIFAAVAQIDAGGWPAWAQSLWAGGAGDAAAFVLTVLLLWLSFTGIATGVISLWLDDIIGAVEAKYYPLARAKPVGMTRAIGIGLGTAIRILLWNALFLPAYLVLLVTGIGPLVLFLIVNAWLLGREYLETVVARHLPPAETAVWLGTHRWDRWGTGLVTAGLFAVPFAGLVAPIVGAAFATHMYHRQTA